MRDPLSRGGFFGGRTFVHTLLRRRATLPPEVMVRVCAVFRRPDGGEVAVAPGELIGRSQVAALRLNDPRVSEAHALVSLRGDRLLLLALRGRLVVEGRRLTEVVLAPGLEVALTPALTLTVVALRLPTQVLAIEGPQLTRQALPGATGLVLHGAPRLVHPTNSEATAWVWPADEGTACVRDGGGDRTVAVGEPFEVEGHSFTVVATPLRRGLSTVAGTEHGGGLRLVVHYDTVHIHRPGRAPALLEGLSARVVGELVAFDAPVGWRILASELWTDGANEILLRKRFDSTLSRLRQRLSAAGIRSDLVRTTGLGLVELVLDPADVVEDRQ